ncbi:hypothetical protein L6E12_27055 [Actinokineospora sp. PR83]|uniref:hypothetical protein n=1 Tax=Actinokineospora sp. PR83 TaxID=2884908 RepID=UPI001F3CFC9F|nr:hypothetical protein [Actinokineospora sp. PR83]MCG8919440.1 hypothetical protein [Actinokineospora sp. PR83]
MTDWSSKKSAEVAHNLVAHLSSDIQRFVATRPEVEGGEALLNRLADTTLQLRKLAETESAD